MRAGLGALLFLALAVVPAAAQSAAWTDESGRVRWDYAPLGWSVIEEHPPSAEEPILLEHLRFQDQTGRLRMCTSRVRRHPAPPHLTQAVLNGLTEARTVENASVDDLTASGLVHTREGDVAIAQFILTGRGYWAHWKTFWILAGSSALGFEFTCGGSPPLSQAEQNNISDLLQRTQIIEQANQ